MLRFKYELRIFLSSEIQKLYNIRLSRDTGHVFLPNIEPESSDVTEPHKNAGNHDV